MTVAGPVRPFDLNRQICYLYRRCLRWSKDWSSSRDYHRWSATTMHLLFRKFTAVRPGVAATDERTIHLRLAALEYCLKSLAHPQPYIYPRSPNGVCFERNLPLPQHIREHGYDEFKKSVL